MVLQPDEAAISAHMQAWFGDVLAGTIEICWTDPETSDIGTKGRWKRFELFDLDEISTFICTINAVTGQNVYFRPALIKDEGQGASSDKHFLYSPGVWCDLDSEGRAESARNVYSTTRPTMAVVTGRHPHMRAQLFWKCRELIGAGETVRTLNESIGLLLDGDPAVKNPTRLMRVGGSIAWPKKPGRVPELTEFEMLQPDLYDLSALQRAFPPQTQKTAEAPGAAPEAPAGQWDFDAGGVDPGALRRAILSGQDWHINTLKLVAHYVNRRLRNSEILDLCDSLTTTGFTIEQTRRDVQKMIDGARGNWDIPDTGAGSTAPEQEQPADSHKAIDWPSCVGEPPEREWTWAGRLPRGTVSSLYGDGGAGKTLLAQQLGTHIATGIPFLGANVIKGPVYALFCEDEDEELWRRQAAINRNIGLNMANVTDFHAVSGFGLDNILMDFDHSIGQTTGLWAHVLSECKRIKPELIIIDNAADTFAGDEIKRSHATQFLKVALGGLAREIGCSVLLLAHPSLTGMASGDGSSGNRAWSNSVRSRLYLTRMEKDNADFDPDIRNLSLMKANYTQQGDEWAMRWRDGAWVYEDDLMTGHVGAIDGRNKQKIILKTIERIAGDGEALSMNSRAGNYVGRRLVKVASIIKAKISRDEIGRHVDTLLDQDLLMLEDFISENRNRSKRLVLTEKGRDEIS